MKINTDKYGKIISPNVGFKLLCWLYLHFWNRPNQCIRDWFCWHSVTKSVFCKISSRTLLFFFFIKFIHSTDKIVVVVIPSPDINCHHVSDSSSRPISPSKSSGFQTRPKMAAYTRAHRAVKWREGMHLVIYLCSSMHAKLKFAFLLVAALFSYWWLSSLQTVDGGDGTHRGIC